MNEIKNNVIDCNAMELKKNPDALIVVNKSIPLHVEFAKENGICKTGNGDVAYLKGDAIVTGVKGEKYPIPREKFDKTYDLIDEENKLYVKKRIEMLAIQINEPFSVNVLWSRDLLIGKPGDWLIEYSNGEYGIIDGHIFKDTYDIIGKNEIKH